MKPKGRLRNQSSWEQMNVTIPADLKRRIVNICEQQDTSITEWVGERLAEAVAREELRRR